jgi:hypothetical protein
MPFTRAGVALALEIQKGAPPCVVGRPGGVWRDLTGAVYGRSIISPLGSWIKWDRVGLFKLEREFGAVRVWPDPGVSSDAVRETFAREVQPIALQAAGFEALHASAALGPAGVVAFCGRTGAGKSTLAYAMTRHGWPQIADDHLIVDLDADAPLVRPLLCEPKLRPASIAHFPPAASDRVPPADAALPLAAVVLLEQTDHAPLIVDVVPQARAFSALLPHAHCFDPQDPNETSRLVNHYLTLVESVPVYHLQYRPSFADLEQITQAVTALGDRRGTVHAV